MTLTRFAVICPIIAIALTGCAQIEKSDALSTERELAAAGFQMKFAKTSDQIAKANSLPQRSLTRTSGPDGKARFVWADATDCGCIYVGTEAAYDRYQRISLKQQAAQEQEMAAAEMSWDDWGPWGPWW